MSDDGSTIKYLLETYQPSGRTKTKIEGKKLLEYYDNEKNQIKFPGFCVEKGTNSKGKEYDENGNIIFEGSYKDDFKYEGEDIMIITEDNSKIKVIYKDGKK